MTFWKRQNYGGSEKIHGFQGLEGNTWINKQMNQQSIGDIEDSGAILYEIIMEDTCHYTFIVTHRIHNTRSEP